MNESFSTFVQSRKLNLSIVEFLNVLLLYINGATFESSMEPSSHRHKQSQLVIMVLSVLSERKTSFGHQSKHFAESLRIVLIFICVLILKMTEKIGEGALMAIKKQSSAIVEFKIPAAPKAKKRQMEILTEEQYIEVRTNTSTADY